MEKTKSTLLLVLSLLVLALLSGCSGNSQTSHINDSVVAAEQSKPEVKVDKVEIFHFHGHHQCYSCKTVGAYAEETVNTYFPEQLESGKIVFGHINRELPENGDLVMKYRVKSASLWIGVYDDDGFHPEENVNVWYKIRDKQDYMDYLKGLIEKRLAGDFS